MSSYRVSTLGESSPVTPRESSKISNLRGSGVGRGDCSPTKMSSAAHLDTEAKIAHEFSLELELEARMTDKRALLEEEQLKRIQQDPAHMREHAKRENDTRVSLLQSRAAVDAHAAELERRATASVMQRNRTELSSAAHEESLRRAYHKQMHDDNRRMMEAKKEADAARRMQEKEFEASGSATAYFSRFGSSMR